jgi:hypothetical protein
MAIRTIFNMLTSKDILQNLKQLRFDWGMKFLKK